MIVGRFCQGGGIRVKPWFRRKTAGSGEAAERGTAMDEGTDKNVCWCFGYTVADIEADLARNDGRSTLMAGIASAKGTPL